jgi:hypothetical protein
MAKEATGQGRDLTDHERTMILPAVQQVRSLQQTLANAQNNLRGLLGLAEPEMLQEGSALTFNMETMRFERRA